MPCRPCRSTAIARRRLDTLRCVIRPWFLAFCAACASWPASAVLIRPDRDDAEYLELASRYTASIALTAPASEAVLVAPRWLLVPASRAPATGKPLEISGRTHVVARVVAHPEAKPQTETDLALVQLARPVDNVKPATIYRRADESGKTVVFVAHGASGVIGKPGRHEDFRGRGAINTVDRVTPQGFESRIKAGDEASDLQGAAVPGEEGAAAYLEDDDGLYLAGIYFADGSGSNRFSRISAFASWLDSVIAAPRPGERR